MAKQRAEEECVAPLAGSVDRNFALLYPLAGKYGVAPLAGSVDRNEALPVEIKQKFGRSPRGERG